MLNLPELLGLCEISGDSSFAGDARGRSLKDLSKTVDTQVWSPLGLLTFCDHGIRLVVRVLRGCAVGLKVERPGRRGMRQLSRRRRACDGPAFCTFRLRVCC